MATYLDSYTFIEVFLAGIIEELRTELLRKQGLTSEAHTIDDFVTLAKSYEVRTRTHNNYNKHSSRKSAQRTLRRLDTQIWWLGQSGASIETNG